MFGPNQADWERLAGPFFTYLKCSLLTKHSYGLTLLLVIMTLKRQWQSAVGAWTSVRYLGLLRMILFLAATFRLLISGRFICYKTCIIRRLESLPGSNRVYHALIGCWGYNPRLGNRIDRSVVVYSPAPSIVGDWLSQCSGGWVYLMTRRGARSGSPQSAVWILMGSV